MKINLTANGKPQELILAYLQANASDVLAEKINNGTPFTKNGKQLVNRKTLDGFMKFASGEAKKLAEKGANSACVEDSVVYGWAIHYFEEESIEGKLYNEDGTEYAPPKPVAKTKPVTPIKVESKKPIQQGSLFDMLSVQQSISEQANDHELMEVDEETGEIIKTDQADDREQAEQIKPYYACYLEAKREYEEYLLFQRLGDFYEVFATDAETASDALDLTLTGRDVGLKERVAMSGIPYHAAEVYFSKLARKGFKIAILEGDNVTTYPKAQTPDGDVDTDVPTVSQIVNELHGQTANLGEKADDIKRAGEILQTFEKEADEEPLDEEHLKTSFDKETMLYLYELLDGKMDIA